MSVYSKLNEIKQIKENLKSSIIAKGVYVSDDVPFEDYPSKIDGIGGGAVDNYAAINSYLAGDLSYSFANFDDVEYEDMNKYPRYAFLKEAALRGDKFTMYKSMFANAYMFNISDTFEILNQVMLNSKDVLGSSPFENMFEGITYYEGMNFDLAGITDIKGMFNKAYYIGSVTLTNTSSVASWINAFKDSQIDGVSGLDFSGATHLNGAFDNSLFTDLDFATTTNTLKYFEGIKSCMMLKTIKNLNICSIKTDMDFSQGNGKIESFTCQAGTITGTFKTLNLSNNNIGPNAMTKLVNSLPTYAAASEADRKTLIVTGNFGTTSITADVIADLATRGWNVTV